MIPPLCSDFVMLLSWSEFLKELCCWWQALCCGTEPFKLYCRFDIVLLLLDQHEPNWDRIVSEHVLQNHQQVSSRSRQFVALQYCVPSGKMDPQWAVHMH
eukprot:GHUV01031458.1.p2 GENE.GHUV01031458.1~~GHUV01031458.1.p2  ORF type:complete len:100 (-),score=20.51 GHUV01031458.1:299-598(-)